MAAYIVPLLLMHREPQVVGYGPGFLVMCLASLAALPILRSRLQQCGEALAHA